MLAVTGGKGGVGKTTTALGVAAAFAREGRRPIVVDADLDAPDLAAVAGVEPCGLPVEPTRSLSAAPTVEGVTVFGATSGTVPERLERSLDRLSDCTRPVVVDCPAGTGTDHGIALRAATDALLVTHPTRQAIADAVKTGTLARRLGATPRLLVVTDSQEVPAGTSTTGLPPAVAIPPAQRSPSWRTDVHRFEPLTRWK